MARALIDDASARRASRRSPASRRSWSCRTWSARRASRPRRLLDAALARGHEGVMAKALDAPYAAGRRGQAWLKIKAAKTLDLVVLAAEWGSGRRQGWLSNLHLGARDPETQRLRHARQDVQGDDRRAARLADRAAAGARHRRTRATSSTCGRSWSSRSRSTICRRARSIPGGLALALRARQALSHRQVGRGS